MPACAAVLILAAATVLLATQLGGSSKSFAAQAATICNESSGALSRLNTHPKSIARAMRLEHAIVSEMAVEVSRLSALHAPTRIASTYEKATADMRSLAASGRWIMARPDYIHLAVSLPVDHQTPPRWLTNWLSRTRALEADLRVRMSKVGVSACDDVTN